MSRRIYWITVSSATLLIGIFLGHWLATSNGPQKIILTKIHPKNISFKFIQPLLGIELTTKGGFLKELQPLKKEVEKTFWQKKQDQEVNSISYYFFDLNTSRWTGFSENDQFDPASLLKVPIMIAYLKRAETNPDLLTTKIPFKVPSSTNNPFLESELNDSVIKPGQTYTVDELIKIMIQNSDNVAKGLLLKLLEEQPALISWKDLNDIFSYLGININNNRDKDLVISARTYSIFLRLLYNANYLDYASSEKALELLSRSAFKDGIVAGVPKNITVANKFGFYDADENGKLVTPELHDCGIVFHPQNPYLICIMTKGNDPSHLKDFIKTLSKITYDFVEKNF
ncbi:MAG: class A beta-lactamase-related serine hydrolase [Candidatus Komeilibacteria bacterium]|nr:class A beta-lactamase-related serine hydrolase [Candidatus Komeilibacteria bacterium]